jgi:hypothetical protein
MAMTKEGTDRRKDKRFRAQEGPVAAVRPYLFDHNPIGKIIDVSLSGLSFSYFATSQKANELSELQQQAHFPVPIYWDSRELQLDVCVKNTGFYLGKIPSKTISDFEVGEKDALGPTAVRRRGVQFGDLTQKQISQLQDFIQKYTAGKV